MKRRWRLIRPRRPDGALRPVGAEADISATSLGGSKSVSANPSTRFTTRSSNELSMLGTVKVRAGLAPGDVLI